MHSDELKEYAKSQTPEIATTVHDNWHRHDITQPLSGGDNIGIELGVAAGGFARRLLDSNKFSHLYGVDIYGDLHNTFEYKKALKTIGLQETRHSLLRMDFDNALEMFDDETFDFIYIDGYAHTGEEGGKTLIDWLPKLKMGGMMAGDDYDDHWPLVKWAVNDLAKQLDVSLNITGQTENKNYSRFPSWYFIRPSAHATPEINDELHLLGLAEKLRIAEKRSNKK